MRLPRVFRGSWGRCHFEGTSDRALALQPRPGHAMTAHASPSRRAGILVPLFSIPSSRSWGIGEIGDIEPMTQWLAAAGQRILQLLPINEMPRHESSPYSALSAMAIDPQFVTMDHVEDFVESGGEGARRPSPPSNRVAGAGLSQFVAVGADRGRG